MMKLLVTYASLQCIFLIETYHARHVTAPEENGIRIPLTRISPTKEEEVNSTVAFRSSNGLTEIHIPLSSYRSELGYYGNISIGTPPQKMKIMFGTGWHHLWVHSSLCNHAECHPQKHNRYDRFSSKTFQKYGESAESIITGPLGTLIGSWSSDIITIEGVQVKNQSFLSAYSMEEKIGSRTNDGFMGLNYKPERDSVNIISKFCELKGMNDSTFSFYLTKNVTEMKGGELMLCGSDRSKYQGKLNYISEVESSLGHSWTIPIEKISVTSDYGGKKSTEIIAANIAAIVDTGTSSVHGKKDHFNAFFRQLEPFFSIDDFLSNLHRLPNVTFRIGGEDYVITGPDYMVRLGHTVMLGITETDTPFSDEWVLGEVFLRNYYSVFDMERRRIGLAKSVQT
ncbi:uncharacterized protein LOC135835676 [Planococcus citri]|uniref:uncharacterized protein LOC135835676 n=1 Tax=Planococcus citri TaxID=170843 RepID=UPI0031F93FF7